MSLPKETREEIKEFLLHSIFEKKTGFIRETTEKFGISRQAVNRYLQSLMEQDIVEKKGSGRNTEYFLKKTRFSILLNVDENLEEDLVWRKEVLPKLPELKQNVLDICQYGFTEMLNNVIDHSESNTVLIDISFDSIFIIFWISDLGVGIFNKIQNDLGLASPRESIIELEKGKFTSDPKHHSGEGIFFTSRAFDKFGILSEDLQFYSKYSNDMFILTPNPLNSFSEGTIVKMGIYRDSKTQIANVFSKYTDNETDYGFSKTEVYVDLMLSKGENLISRSQAKRLLNGFEKFKTIILVFDNIESIGQGFADEIFRVFKNNHPDIEIIPTHAGEDVMRMIMHVLRSDKSPATAEDKLTGRSKGKD
ncbi:MAG: DUF4325 domain-containing protein [Brevinematales bacterium]|nr:DUF4325 domain-containing protein [Brevinematales bacterium]